MSVTRVNPEYQPKGNYLAYTDYGQAAKNLNDITQNGVFTMLNPTNAPVANKWVTVIALRFNNNAGYMFQVAFVLDSNTVHVRFRIGNTWQAWKKVTMT